MQADKYRVMIVDDDADMRSLLGMTLSGDFEVFEANNGLDAILKVSKYEPDVAIIDIMMPLMDGKELMRKIKSMPGNEAMPLVALSALNGKDDIRQGYDAGADLYLTKPFDPDRLLRNLRISLDKRPVRAKKLSIEEIEERELRYAEQMKRALEKKRTTAREESESRQSVRTPAPEVVSKPASTSRKDESSSSDVQRMMSSLPRIEGITAPRKTPATPPPPKEDTRQSTAAQEEERYDPFAVERTGVPPRRKGARDHKPDVAFTEIEPAPKVAPTPRVAGEIRPRVLIVDDDEDYLLVMRTALEDHFEVVVARDGFEATNRMPETEPDIFVIDAMMPRMSGYQLIDMIKGSLDTYFKPIIFASAKGSPRDLKLAEEKGVNKYMVKPFGPDALIKALKDIVAEPAFRPQMKTHTIQEILLEDGRRRAAHISAGQRKKMWESFGQIEKFLKDTKE